MVVVLVLGFVVKIMNRIVRSLLGGIGLLILMLALQYSTPPLGERWTAVGILARDYQFDYITWELNALSVKVNQTLYGLHPFMTEADRSNVVREYMNDLARAQRLENEVSFVFADPSVSDPETASADLRAERDALRADLETRQPLVEAILEGQVATVLVEEGFGFAGQLIPPISMHFSQVPNLLVVSPRDEIRFDVSINLKAMTVDEQAALEDRIANELDVSALVTPLGGIALYPAMILETTSIPYAADVIAHEWLHHYLFAFPLGYQYDFAGEARIINETTANLFGQEIGPMVIERYYPELTALDTRVGPVFRNDRQDQPPFDFGAEMHETRVTVDELLEQGEVEEAEAYMEARRHLFVANGYLIRKLNQAYFAFYGGYQSGAPGVGGSDPIGPAIQAIRDASPSIHDWIVTMRGITTREELLAVRDRLVTGQVARQTG